MKLNEINHGIHKHKKRLRVGRGLGSGQGKTAGRGHKGQMQHPGWSCPPAFQGGTMSLVRRVPKRGFHNKFAVNVVAINVGTLEASYEAGETVSPETLRAKGIVRVRYEELKILGEGTLTKALKVSAHRYSASAREKISQAGGEVAVLAGKVPVAEKQGKSQKE